MDTSIRVRILDREYPLRVRAEDEAQTRRMARYVDEKLRAVRATLKDQPDTTVGIVGALALAEELFAAHEALERLRRSADRELDRLDRQLAAALAPPAA